jgi:chemotaxis protein MotB
MSDEIEVEEESGDGWLVGYADMMTLIACFFILMMAFANYEPVGFQQKAEQLSKSFRKDKYKSSTEKSKFIEEEITKHPTLPQKTKLSVKDSVLKVVFSGSAVFENGEYKLKGDTLKTVDSLIDILKTTNPHYRILIEGHADDDLDKIEGLENNWQLSALRATAIIQRFEYFGFPTHHLTAIAKSDSVPIVKSKDTKGKRIDKLAKMNRRVVIKVLEPTEKKKVKLGLGVYFEDSTTDVNEGHDY